MKNLILTILTALIVCSAFNYATAQKKMALEVPLIFYPPQDNPKVKILEDIENTKITDKVEGIEDVAWSVFSDREGNVTDKGFELKFKDQFYVIAEKENTIHIVQGSKTSNNNLKIEVSKDFGWIEKSKMLLWSQALTDPISKINRKGFLLNKTSSLNAIRDGKADKVLVKVLNTPTPIGTPNEIVDKKRIYEFFFILKKVKRDTENDSLYLLARNVRINSLTSGNDIIGWVDASRITEWNTRLALEPNFAQAAFEERKADGKKHVKLFDEADNAVNFANGKSVSNQALIWDYDPVKLKANKLAKSDPLRFRGNWIRFPMLSKNNDLGFFKTAVVSEITLAKLSGFTEIDIVDAAPFLDDIDKFISSKKNVNVVFVVEGSANLQKYTDAISQSIANISRDNRIRSKTVQYGAAVYNNPTDFSYESISPDYERVIDFLNEKASNQKASSYNQSMFSGLTQTLKKTGLNEDDNNIIVLVGNKGNIGSSPISSKEAESALNKWSASLIGVNCKFGQSTTGNFRDLKILLIETAKISSNKCRIPWKSLNLRSPVFEGNVLQNSDFYGSYNEVSDMNTLSEQLTTEVFKSIDFSNDITRMLGEIFNDGKAAPENMGVADAAINRIVCELADKNNLSEEDVRKFAYEKFQLYLDAYAPIKVNEAQQNYFSNVLFLPRSDLVDLRNKLRPLVYSENSTPNKKRDDLKEAWIELLRIYTGETNKDNLTRYSIDDWIKIYVGLEGEDIKIGKESVLQGKSIKDIGNPKKVSKEDINAYIDQVYKNYTTLDNILKESYYEFSYASNGNTYYWIPVEFLP